MRLLVTGGAGFIGSNFIRYCAEVRPAWTIVCIDSLTYAGDKSRLRELPNLTELVVADINQIQDTHLKSDDFDAIVHFAAESHNDNSIKNPSLFTRTNINGTESLLHFALKSNLRFHYVSTDEIYGDLDFNSTELFTESSPINPSSPYSASKAAAGLLVAAWSRTYNLATSSSACSNNYGPNQNIEKFLPRSIALARNGLPIELYGQGLNVRDWISVDDHSSALVFMLENGLQGHYNIGVNDEWTNLQVAQFILMSLGLPSDFIKMVGDRPGHDRRYGIDSSKLRSAGWKPSGSKLDSYLEEVLGS